MPRPISLSLTPTVHSKIQFLSTFFCIPQGFRAALPQESVLPECEGPNLRRCPARGGSNPRFRARTGHRQTPGPAPVHPLSINKQGSRTNFERLPGLVVIPVMRLGFISILMFARRKAVTPQVPTLKTIAVWVTT